MKSLRVLLPILVLTGMGTALAQGLPGMGGPSGGVPQKAPPIKKFQGVCYPPESMFYKRVPEPYVPFVGMVDCLKSGGVAAKK